MAGKVLPLPSSPSYIEGKASREVRALVSGHFRNRGLASPAGGRVGTKRPRGAIPNPLPLRASVVPNPRFVADCMEVLPGSTALQAYPWPNPTLFIKQNGFPCHGLVGSPRKLLSKYRHPTGSVRAGLQDGSTDPLPSRQCIVLDIEGTTTPITFVTDVLFPYARDNVRKHLMATYDSEETKEDIKLLRAQVEDDLKNGVMGSVPVPSDDAGKEKVIDSLVTNVEAMIQADRKITSLKQMQGHIWRTGFENKELQGIVYEDVPKALHKWHANGIKDYRLVRQEDLDSEFHFLLYKVYIYSSGSREAQRLIFGNTTHGDLRKNLSGFFDTMVGNKREPKSYFEISQSLGVDKPSQVLFVTDVYQEAVAAKAAGLEVVISVRPGNAPLPENHGFATINSFAEI